MIRAYFSNVYTVFDRKDWFIDADNCIFGTWYHFSRQWVALQFYGLEAKFMDFEFCVDRHHRTPLPPVYLYWWVPHYSCMGQIFRKYSSSKGNAVFEIFITGNLKDMINISSKTGSVIQQIPILIIFLFLWNSYQKNIISWILGHNLRTQILRFGWFLPIMAQFWLKLVLWQIQIKLNTPK